MGTLLDIIQRAILGAFGVVMGVGLAFGGLWFITRLLYFTVMLVGGFITRSRQRRAAQRMTVAELHEALTWLPDWYETPEPWDDPWVDNGIELGNVSPERRATAINSLPVVQLNRVTGQYDTILGGYLKQEGGDN